MNSIRFIHTADVHLGSFLHMAGDSMFSRIERSIEEATLESFNRICNIAISNEVDFMVISGDLYDREARSVRAQSFFMEQCKRLEESHIDVYVIAGNHDPLRENYDLFRFPDNVKFFSGDKPEVFEVFNREGMPIARVIGQSYQGRSEVNRIHLDYDVMNKDLWNIALLHTQLESGTSNYVPCTLGELKEREDIHYWALGHIHKYQVLNEGYPFIVYPGIPQGRDFGEEGRGGCVLVELGGSEANAINFIPIGSVVYKKKEIFIDADTYDTPETLEDLEDKIYHEGNKLLEEVGDGEYPIDGYVVEWIIRGRSTIHNRIKEQGQEILELLTLNLRTRFQHSRPFLWTNSINFQTKNPIDFDNLLRNSQVLDELDKVIEGYLQDEEKRYNLIEQLGEIWSGDGAHEEHGDKNDFRFHMDEEHLEMFLNNARQMIVEKLVMGRE